MVILIIQNKANLNKKKNLLEIPGRLLVTAVYDWCRILGLLEKNQDEIWIHCCFWKAAIFSRKCVYHALLRNYVFPHDFHLFHMLAMASRLNRCDERINTVLGTCKQNISFETLTFKFHWFYQTLEELVLGKWFTQSRMLVQT